MSKEWFSAMNNNCAAVKVAGMAGYSFLRRSYCFNQI